MSNNRVGCFDLSGTILDHKGMQRPVPLMPQLIEQMQEDGWECLIVTRWSEDFARECLDAGGLDLGMEVISASDKGRAVRSLLDRRGKTDTLIHVDDRPDNLRNVQAVDDGRVRPIGFLGTGKFRQASRKEQKLPAECARMGIELALSAPDLAEALEVHLPDHGDAPDLAPAELASLLPGLDHPCSAIAGETRFFDHRWPLSELRRSCDDWWRHAWPQVGWIACNECLWKALVGSVLASTGADRKDILGNAYKHHEYTEALTQADEPTKEQLTGGFQYALRAIVDGLADVGIEAQRCRPIGRPMEPNRVEVSIERLEEVYGPRDWIEGARLRLREIRETGGPARSDH